MTSWLVIGIVRIGTSSLQLRCSSSMHCEANAYWRANNSDACENAQALNRV